MTCVSLLRKLLQEKLGERMASPARSYGRSPNPIMTPLTSPDHWQTAIVTLLAKRPQADKLEDFRPISLIPQLQKLYSKWLYSLFLPAALQKIPSTQHGFRPHRQCAEVHHIFGRLREIGQEWRHKYVAMKVDVEKPSTHSTEAPSSMP